MEDGTQNRLKFDPKIISKVEGIQVAIFLRFSWVLDTKLGGKINEKSFQEGVEKHDEKRTQLKRSRSQFSARPGGMREAPGENKEGVSSSGE